MKEIVSINDIAIKCVHLQVNWHKGLKLINKDIYFSPDNNDRNRMDFRVNSRIIQDLDTFLHFSLLPFIHSMNFTLRMVSLVIKGNLLVQLWHMLPHSASVDLGWIE